MASAHADLPAPPDDVAVSPAIGKLTVTWRPPAPADGSPVYGYVVRHKLSSAGDDAWVSRTALLPSPARAICTTSGCRKPGALEITGLGSGADYDVQIQSLNANGASDWLTIGTTHTPQ